MKKFLILGFAMFSIMACTATDPYAFDQAKFNDNNYAYVVFGAMNNASPSDFTVYNQFSFTDYESWEELYLNDVFGKEKGFMIPAGNYKLANLKLNGSKSVGNTKRFVDLDFDNEQIAGNFSVKPGEVVYLGYVNTTIKGVNRTALGRLFGRATNATDLVYTTEVLDKFKEIDKDKYEQLTGKKITSRIMEWKKIED